MARSLGVLGTLSSSSCAQDLSVGNDGMGASFTSMLSWWSRPGHKKIDSFLTAFNRMLLELMDITLNTETWRHPEDIQLIREELWRVLFLEEYVGFCYGLNVLIKTRIEISVRL
jgi:hypothetical protein